MAIVTYSGGADPVREGFNLLYQFEKVTATTTEFLSTKKEYGSSNLCVTNTRAGTGATNNCTDRISDGIVADWDLAATVDGQTHPDIVVSEFSSRLLSSHNLIGNCMVDMGSRISWSAAVTRAT